MRKHMAALKPQSVIGWLVRPPYFGDQSFNDFAFLWWVVSADSAVSADGGEGDFQFRDQKVLTFGSCRYDLVTVIALIG